MVSEFRARAWGDGPSTRFRGVLAWNASGSVRAEVAAPSVTMPLILVVTPGGVLAASMSDRAYYLGDPSDPVLERLTGVPLSAQVISRLLLPDVAPFEPGCDAHRGRYRRVEDFGRIATRLEVRCAAAGLRLSLDSPRIHLLDGRNPFALDPGPGFHATTLQDLTARIEDSLREAP